MYLVDLLLNDLRQFGEDGEVRQDTDQHDERVAYLHVVAGIQADHHRFGDFVVPFMAHMSRET